MSALFPGWVATEAWLSLCTSPQEEEDIRLASFGCSHINDPLNDSQQIVGPVDVASKTELVRSSICSDHIGFCMPKKLRNIFERKTIPAEHGCDGATRTMAGNRSSGIFLWNASTSAKSRNQCTIEEACSHFLVFEGEQEIYKGVVLRVDALRLLCWALSFPHLNCIRCISRDGKPVGAFCLVRWN